jgi:predicted phage-related endonuclease
MSADFFFINYPTEEAWRQERWRYANASETPTVLGTRTWDSPYHLNLVKRGIIEQSYVPHDKQQDMKWSRDQEERIVNWWWNEGGGKKAAEKHFDCELSVWRAGPFMSAFSHLDHLKEPVVYSCTPDYVLVDFDLGYDDVTQTAQWNADSLAVIASHTKAAVEIKDYHEFTRSKFDEGIPLDIRQQIQHQLMVMNLDVAYAVVSIGGNLPQWRAIHAVPKGWEIIQTAWNNFWKSIEADQDLEPDALPATAESIRARYPKDNDETIMLTSDVENMWNERKDISANIKQLKERYEYLTNKIKIAMGDNSYGIFPNGEEGIKLLTQKNGKRVLRKYEV